MKVAISLCPNDIFVFSGLILKTVANPYEIDIFVIDELNRQIFKETYDFIKVSSAVLLEAHSYELTHVGASFSIHGGPLLVKRKDEDVADHKIGVPSLSSTSALLVRKYFPHLHPVEYPLKMLSELLQKGEIDYAVLINEDQHRIEPLGFEVVADLAQLWYKEFKTYLPLGLLAAKKNMELHDKEKFETLVHQSVLWARDHRDKALELSMDYTGNQSLNLSHIEAYTCDAHFNPSVSQYFQTFSHSVLGERHGS